jgi:hypothetical protein
MCNVIIEDYVPELTENDKKKFLCLKENAEASEKHTAIITDDRIALQEHTNRKC